MQGIEHLGKTLKLTSEQKTELVPILKEEAPRIQALKSNPSLSGIQKILQIRTIHAETDPKVKSILNPEQYQQLQDIREKEIQRMVKKKLGG